MYSRKKKRARPGRIALGILGLVLMLAASVIALNDYLRFMGTETAYPAGLSLSGIPIGGLNRSEAEARLNEAYALPVELVYEGSRMQFDPQALGFAHNAALVLDAYEEAGGSQNSRWWGHLWGIESTPEPVSLDLHPSSDPAAIRQLLSQDVQPRYDRPAYAPDPILNSTYFEPGQAGWQLSDPEESVRAIQAALASRNSRVVDLHVTETPAPPLDPKQLELALKQLVHLEGFDGLVELYTQDIRSGEILHFAYQNYQDLTPDIAYPGASTIKIPIMVSVMRSLAGGELPNLADGWIFQMLTKSLNPPADALMRTYLNAETGPLTVTRDMQDLGYQNTFMAGYFEPGSPLLQRFSTPANQRTDINLNPDIYNQTVPSEIGDLLGRIYRCSEGSDNGQGLFPGQITQAHCQYMIETMSKNVMGALIEAGLPPSQSVAHKHGWTSDTDGFLHTISDVGIVLDPETPYVLVAFVHTPQQLIFDRGSNLVARLSQCIYNSKNINNQAYWLGE